MRHPTAGEMGINLWLSRGDPSAQDWSASDVVVRPSTRPQALASRRTQDVDASPRALLLAAEAAEAFVEAGELAAGVEQLLLAAGPGRVRLAVDLQAQRVARLAVGG